MTLRHEQHRFAAPLATAHGTINDRRCLVVTVDQDGFSGEGEAAPLPGFGLESYDEALAQLERWASGGSTPDSPAASAAAQTAIANLTAGAEERPLHRFLGSASDGPLAVQALVGSPTAEGVDSTVRTAVARGHRGIKLKVGAADVDADIERIRAARAAAPAGTLVRLDANQGWTLEQARLVLTAVADLDIDLVEEPTPNVDDWRELATGGWDLAVDEQLASPGRAQHLLDLDFLRGFVLKPAVLGGPVTTRRIAERLADEGKRSIVSSFMDGPVGLRATRDLALAVDAAGTHGVGTAPLFADAFPLDVTPLAGALWLDLADLELPPGVDFARTTPTFDERSVPPGLLAAHQVAAGVWGVVRIESGRLEFTFEEPLAPGRILEVGEHQVIPPGRPHRVRPAGECRFAVEFHREVS